MDRRIALLREHIIVCGAGPTGQRIIEDFYQAQVSFVLIEQSPDVIAQVLQIAEDILFLEADATEDETLIDARIEHATGLVASLGEDKDNVFVVLSARALNPALHIVARVVDEENTPKLLKAGADHVVSPNAIGGRRMASLMIRPSVVDFMDHMLLVPDETLALEEVHVSDRSKLIGKSLGEAHIRRRFGLLVVAFRSQSRGYVFNPDADNVLQHDDTLIVMGTAEQIKRFRETEDWE